ncbi:MAG: PDZ domain-containing protein [Candidatus Moranbacteria bacterium]|jgi:serine protease Do|nr:PDZ domain-containing protein [Candidatus Moranbacteria bacterium]MBP9801620.1 PDZ domain-containing protein [Candidatus Moranbacteria bacterium]
MNIRQTAKWIGIIISIFMLGGTGGVFFDRSFLPWLAVQRGLDRVGFLKRAADNVTIINKTEQILVQEDNSLGTIVSQPSTAVVTLIPRLASTAEQNSQIKKNPVTGVLLTNDGVIVTYRKQGIVETNFESMTALLFDGSSHEARFIGVDPLTELAFFRIDVVDVPSISLADSDSALVGKKLIAFAFAYQSYQRRFMTGTLDTIDTPFNLSGKTVSSTEKWEGVFRMNLGQDTDFVGGPVIQYNGEMLGIVGSLSIDNISQTFILPAKAVRQSLDFILSGKNLKRPVFGAYYVPLTQAYALQHGLTRTEGALIHSPSGKSGLALISGKSAEKAGLQVNDIVVAVNNETVTLANPLAVLLARFRSGEVITLSIDRAGTLKDILVTL